MTATTLQTLKKIKTDAPVSEDAYVMAGRDYLIEQKLVRDNWAFQTIINDDTASGLTRHFKWSIKGLDLIVYALTNKEFRTLKEMIKRDYTL